MKKRTVTISSREVEIDIVRSSRRTVALYVKPGGTLLLRAPWYVPVTLLMQFVRQKTAWVERQMRRLNDVKPLADPLHICDGSTIPFMGRQVTVRVTTGGRNSAVLKGNELHLTLAEAVSAERITGLAGAVSAERITGLAEAVSAERITALAEAVSAERITALAEAWYLREAKSHFTSRTAVLAALHSSLLPAPGPVNVRKMKRRWGTCHSSGAIWFNRELIKKEQELIDYVIIHELCHLVHPNHGSEYYALLGSIIPDFRVLKKRLQQ